MTESKAWAWSAPTSEIWLEASVESYHLAERWKSLGYKSILDLGCGLGRHSILFAQRGFEVTALDLAPEAVDHLKAWAEREHLNIPAHVCDMLKTSFPDKSFDCIFAHHVISHTDTNGAREIFAELKRIIKPGGELYATFCSKATWAWTDAGFPLVDENTVVKTCEGPEYGIPHYHVTLEDLPRLFPEYKILNVRHITDYNETSVPSTTHYFMIAKAL